MIDVLKLKVNNDPRIQLAHLTNGESENYHPNKLSKLIIAKVLNARAALAKTLNVTFPPLDIPEELEDEAYDLLKTTDQKEPVVLHRVCIHPSCKEIIPKDGNPRCKEHQKAHEKA